jgi:hypothetical protein
MKRSLIIIFATCLTICSLKTLAQKETRKWGIGILFESGLPLGDASNTYNLTSGASLRFFYRAGPGFVTLSGGAVAYLPKNLFSALTDTTGTGLDNLKAGLQIPIKAGYKYIFKHHFFVMGEIGISSFRVYYKDDNDNVQSTNTSGCFTFAPSAGFQNRAFEIGIKYETFQVNGKSVSNIGIRSGFNF